MDRSPNVISVSDWIKTVGGLYIKFDIDRIESNVISSCVFGLRMHNLTVLIIYLEME